jgi:hypothetical protein
MMPKRRRRNERGSIGESAELQSDQKRVAMQKKISCREVQILVSYDHHLREVL